MTRDSILFFSVCPRCGQPRVQTGYTRVALRRLLDLDYTIYAYCSSCDVQWPISADDLAKLVRRLGN